MKKYCAFLRFMGIFLFPLLGTFVCAQQKVDVGAKENQEVQTKITYCNMELSPAQKWGNLSFNALYFFKVNGEGNVTSLEKIRDDFIGEDKVKLCISSWKLKGFTEGAKFGVTFYWKHGIGWMEQKISGNGFVQTMSLDNAEQNAPFMTIRERDSTGDPNGNLILSRRRFYRSQ